MKTMTMTDSRQLPANFALLTVGDLMQRELITVRAADPLHEVEQVLAEAGVSGVPVVDDREQILGVLSVSDLVGRYADVAAEQADAGSRRGGDYEDQDEDTEVLAFERPRDGGLCAGDLMNPQVIHVPATTCLREAARTMVQNNIHRLLVTERGRVIGLVSTLDILRALAD